VPLIIGVDPGTGSSSDTGFSVIDTETSDILYASRIPTQKRLVHHRIKEISDVFDLTLQDIDKVNKDAEVIVCIESFVMRGKGGETLQRLIGSFMGRIPYRFELVHIQNTTIKLMLAGHGHADKESVAAGLASQFEANPKSHALIMDLIRRQEFDILDSLAIGVSGWQQTQLERNGEQRKPVRTKKRKP